MSVQNSPDATTSVPKTLLRRTLGHISFRMGITGDVRDRFMAVLDRVFPVHGTEVLRERDVRLELDLAHANERLLSYLFTNVIRHYEHTPLYRLMAQVSRLEGQGTFVDIGANLGVFSYLADRLGFASVAVEPDPTHVDFLRRNSDYVSRVYDIALSDSSGEMEFYVADDQNPGASSLVPGGSSVETSSIYGTSVKVSVMPFSDFVSEHIDAPGDIRLIKIDVEGHEVATLRGCEGFLERGNRPLIWCEVRGPQSGRAPSSFAAAMEFLAPYDYVAYRYDGEHLERFDAKRHDVPQVFDLLFADREFANRWP